MEHALKCEPEPFSALRRRLKHHEIRREDTRRFALGDTLILREWDPTTSAYTGEVELRAVTYLTRGPQWGVPAGLVVMSLADTRPGNRSITGHVDELRSPG
jgi:Domain of unknown function (DUF3850)